MNPLSVCCRVLGLTIAGFYASATRPLSAPAIERAKLRETIQTIFSNQASRGSALSIYPTIRKPRHYTGSHDRILALIRAIELRAKAAKKYKVTSDSGHAMSVAAKLLGQDFSCDISAESASHAKAPDQMWLDDITYLWTTEDSLFTCCVLDLFTRRLSASRLSHTCGALLP